MALFDDGTVKKAMRTHQGEIDFNNALYQGLVEELKGWLLKKSSRLLSFNDVKDKLELGLVRDTGLQNVPIDNIIGSQGRDKSFTRRFLPRHENLRNRWKKVDEARLLSYYLPPVELYKVGNAYFVKDGHHRVSVARTGGVKYIEAKVFEYECIVPVNEDTDSEKLAIQEAYHQFLKETGLQKAKPGADMQLTLPGGYTILMKHIRMNQHYLEQKTGNEITLADAARSWYDHLYSPFARLIKNHNIMHRFPHRTEADFYIWVNRHGDRLIQEIEDGEEIRRLIDDYSKKYDRFFYNITGPVKRFFGLVRYE